MIYTLNKRTGNFQHNVYKPQLVATAFLVNPSEDYLCQIPYWDYVNIYWDPCTWAFRDQQDNILFEQETALPKAIRTETIRTWIESFFAYDSSDWKIKHYSVPQWGINND